MVKNGWEKSTTQIPPKTPRTISNDASNIQENQVTMLTENIIKTFDIWNQITLDSIDISKENIKIYTEAMTSMDIYNRDLIISWNSFLIPSYCK